MEKWKEMNAKYHPDIELRSDNVTKSRNYWIG